MGEKQHPGWQPARLKEHREAHGLTLEAAGVKLREVAARSGLTVPAANFQTLWSHENGTVYPGPHYRRAYCLLYQATEPQLGFRLSLPGEGSAALAESANTSASVADDVAAQSIETALARVTLNSSNSDAAMSELLKARIIEAWKRRYSGGNPTTPTLTLVGGYAGCGKTEFARFLSSITGWALLDKDSLTRPLVESLLVSFGADPNDRESEIYRQQVRPLEYRCLMETAYDNLGCGISTVLAAPFIAELAQESWLQRLTNRCKAKSVDVAVIWVECDTDSMRDYLEFRAAARDAWKLANWDDYLKGIDLHARPRGAHLVVNNSLGAAISVADQTREALRRFVP